MLSAHGWNKRQASLIPRLCEYIGPVSAGLVGKRGRGVGFALSAYYWVLKDQPIVRIDALLCGVWGCGWWTVSFGLLLRDVLLVGVGSAVR